MALWSVSVALILAMVVIFLPHALGKKLYNKGGGGQSQSQSNGCDLFEGRWVFDDSYSVYDSMECPYINPGLNCQKNGRPDKSYLNYRWKPNACDLPRFDGQDLLGRLRGKKIMFVGDSLSSNQWQSLACMLHDAIPTSSPFNLTQTKSLSSLSFPEYGVSVMYLKNGFLVDLVTEKIGKVLKLDSISRSEQWNAIDILIFNSYHWWLHTGNLQTWDYFQVGDKLSTDMDRMEAYGIALTTWSKWIDSNIDPSKSSVFFQGISAVHYGGKEWNEPTASTCDGQTKPIEGSIYPGNRYPGEAVVKKVLSDMKTPVTLLDITLLTQLRKDGHPSTYADVGSVDCSHWCLAGVPDAWNQILYAILIGK
ncbi:hypothetical protein LguiB_002796 [Lonicera macranthoides]